MTWRQAARVSMANRIEEDHINPDETVTFKVPFTLPYPSAGGTFEPVKGEFEHSGEFYKLIKQKLENDTLYVVAVKDVKEKAIVNVMSQFVKSTSSQPSKSAAFKLLHALAKDYVPSAIVPMSGDAGWVSEIIFTSGHPELLTHCIPVVTPPPDSRPMMAHTLQIACQPSVALINSVF